MPWTDDETEATENPATESPASVLLLTRDGLENVVHPRLTAAGADMKRVRQAYFGPTSTRLLQ